jgi:hypothetical protein
MEEITTVLSDITITIDTGGDLLFIDSLSADIFKELGTARTRRASFVEPYRLGYRTMFHLLRLFGDNGRIAQWTREWSIVWRVNMGPIGGPILLESFNNRQQAIAAEIEAVNKFFLRRTTNVKI